MDSGSLSPAALRAEKPVQNARPETRGGPATAAQGNPGAVPWRWGELLAPALGLCCCRRGSGVPLPLTGRRRRMLGCVGGCPGAGTGCTAILGKGSAGTRWRHPAAPQPHGITVWSPALAPIPSLLHIRRDKPYFYTLEAQLYFPTNEKTSSQQ